MLDAQQFQLAFYKRVLAAHEMVVQGQIINIDGKRLDLRKTSCLGNERFTW